MRVLEDHINSEEWIRIRKYGIVNIWDRDGIAWIVSNDNPDMYEFVIETKKGQLTPELKYFIREYRLNKILNNEKRNTA